MSAPQQRVVVGVDGSDGGRSALAWALTEAAARGADLEVLSAFPVDFYWTDAYLADRGRVETLREETQLRTQALIDEVRADPAIAAVAGVAGVHTRVAVVSGAAAGHLVERSSDADLLVVGSRGRGGVRSAVAGSVALHCASHARCPVVVVHPAQQPPDDPARVVVGLDDSAEGRAALRAAKDWADRSRARLDAVVAYEPPDNWSDAYALMAPPLGESHGLATKRAEEVLEAVLGGSSSGNDVRLMTVSGPPGEVLVDEARGARLLVVGSRSRNRLAGLLLGSVALSCVMHAPCPVLVVRPARARRHAERAPALSGGAPATTPTGTP